MEIIKTITIEEALKNGNSSINQSIKDKFVQQHVYANVNEMTEYILSKSFEDNNAPFTIDDIKNYYVENEEGDSEASEVFEWWIVSSYLADKLADLGHPIIKSHNIWGRCTSGQATSLDYAITKICAEMEILEGQANSWA